MSFASDTKLELCSCEYNENALKKAELYAFLLFGRSFSPDSIAFSTEHEATARLLCNMLVELTGCIADMISTRTNKKSGCALYTVTVPDSNDRKKILELMGHTGKEINLRINKAIIDTQETSGAFIKGAFLACGSLSDPKNEYHLEFVVPFMNLARDLCNVIAFSSENRTEKHIRAGIVVRKGCHVVYLKDKDMIAELLGIMGASSANIEFVQTIIHKDIINRTNRRTNSELANLRKTAQASALQLDAIKTIMYNNQMELLPPELRELSMLRWENPEMSLRELSLSLSAPISRSGINHRFERIISIANSLKKEKDS